MSNITSSAYPVVTVTKSGDQFAVVQGGQLKKLTREGLGAYIQQLAPNTLLSLTDVPGSFVGQQGLGLVVNATETGMEFAPTVSSNFLALTDTPNAYGGKAGKVLAANNAETALEFIDSAFINQADTPASYAGQAGKVLKVNGAEDGIFFDNPVSVEANFSGGFWDYNHGGTTQAYTGGSGDVALENDETGIQTLKTYAAPGIADVWSPVTNRFDWSSLELGDMVDIRVDVEVTTSITNQQFEIDLVLGEGGSPYSIVLGSPLIKAASTVKFSRYNGIYIGDLNTRDNPAKLVFNSNDDATIKVNGWYVKVIKRGIS